MSQSNRNTMLNMSTIIVLVILILMHHLVLAEEPKCPFSGPSGIQTKYDESMCRLPLNQAVNQIVEWAQKGDCKAAYYLSSLARDKKIFYIEKHDGKFWADFALEICNEFERAEMGYPYEYTNTAEIVSAESRLEVRSFFKPLDPKISYPVCYEQHFLFFNKDKLHFKRIIKYRNIPSERLLVTRIFYALVNGVCYYIVHSFNYGGSCCAWWDVFDANGYYVGSLYTTETRFGLRGKIISPILLSAIWDERTMPPVIIDQYPK